MSCRPFRRSSRSAPSYRQPPPALFSGPATHPARPGGQLLASRRDRLFDLNRSEFADPGRNHAGQIVLLIVARIEHRDLSLRLPTDLLGLVVFPPGGQPSLLSGRLVEQLLSPVEVVTELLLGRTQVVQVAVGDRFADQVGGLFLRDNLILRRRVGPAHDLRIILACFFYPSVVPLGKQSVHPFLNLSDGPCMPSLQSEPARQIRGLKCGSLFGPKSHLLFAERAVLLFDSLLLFQRKIDRVVEVVFFQPFDCTLKRGGQFVESIDLDLQHALHERAGEIGPPGF